MLTPKNYYKMIALGLLLTFISPQTLLCDQAKGNWEKFNYNEVTYHRGWYGKIENTLKETSVTGKGPLWAQVATSITGTKTEQGDPHVVGFKMKL